MLRVQVEFRVRLGLAVCFGGLEVYGERVSFDGSAVWDRVGSCLSDAVLLEGVRGALEPPFKCVAGRLGCKGMRNTTSGGGAAAGRMTPSSAGRPFRASCASLTG